MQDDPNNNPPKTGLSNIAGSPISGPLLSVKVIRIIPTDCGSSFQYQVEVKAGSSEKWHVFRRFSEFANLRRLLSHDGLYGLPGLPSKLSTLKGPALAEHRKPQLQDFLMQLLRRPDCRTSPNLLAFLEIEDHTHTCVLPLALSLHPSEGCNVTYSARHFAWDSCEDVFYVISADTSIARRFGRAWTLVEEEPEGCVTAIKLESGDADDASAMSQTQQGILNGTSRYFARRLNSVFLNRRPEKVYYDTSAKTLLVAVQGGEILLMDTRPTLHKGTYTPQLVIVARMEVHISANIVDLYGSNAHVIFSAATDNSIRLLQQQPIHATTSTTTTTTVVPQYKVTSGGRISKPLAEKETITRAAIDFSASLAFVGTNQGRLLLYSCESNPASHIATANLSLILSHISRKSTSISHDAGGSLSPMGLAGRRIVTSTATGSQRVEAIHVHSDTNEIFVAIHSIVLVCRYGVWLKNEGSSFTGAVDETRAAGSYSSSSPSSSSSEDVFSYALECPFHPDAAITAVYACDETKKLFVAHGSILVVWCLISRQLLQCVTFPQWGSIHHLAVIKKRTVAILDAKSDPKWLIKNTSNLMQDVSSIACRSDNRCFHVKFLSCATNSAGVRLLNLQSIDKWAAYVEDRSDECICSPPEAEQESGDSSPLKSWRERIAAAAVVPKVNDDDDLLGAFDQAVF